MWKNRLPLASSWINQGGMDAPCMFQGQRLEPRRRGGGPGGPPVDFPAGVLSLKPQASTASPGLEAPGLPVTAPEAGCLPFIPDAFAPNGEAFVPEASRFAVNGDAFAAKASHSSASNDASVTTVSRSSLSGDAFLVNASQFNTADDTSRAEASRSRTFRDAFAKEASRSSASGDASEANASTFPAASQGFASELRTSAPLPCGIPGLLSGFEPLSLPVESKPLKDWNLPPCPQAGGLKAISRWWSEARAQPPDHGSASPAPCRGRKKRQLFSRSLRGAAPAPALTGGFTTGYQLSSLRLDGRLRLPFGCLPWIRWTGTEPGRHVDLLGPHPRPNPVNVP